MNRILTLAFAVIVMTVAALPAAGEPSWIPDKGFVPDSQTAIRIAEAVWIPIYGEKMIALEKPYIATLKGDVWTVTGSMPSGEVAGGTALAQISKRDGRILKVIHER